MGKIITIIIILLVIGSFIKKEPSEQQRSYDALVEKNKSIEAANPGSELAALKCMQLADIQENVGKERARNGLDTSGYNRTDAYRMCMRNKGFGHLLK